MNIFSGYFQEANVESVKILVQESNQSNHASKVTFFFFVSTLRRLKVTGSSGDENVDTIRV